MKIDPRYVMGNRLPILPMYPLSHLINHPVQHKHIPKHLHLVFSEYVFIPAQP